MNKDDAIAIACSAAAKAAFEANGSAAYSEEQDEEVPPRRSPFDRSRFPGLTVAEVSWGHGPRKSLRLVKRLSESVIEGDLAGAPRWALKAITEAARSQP